MGFGKSKLEAATKKKAAAVAPTTKKKTFVPSTDADLKRYAKDAKRKDKLRKEVKSAKKGTPSKHPKGVRDITAALAANEDVRIFKPQFFDRIMEYAKENGAKDLPAYKEYLPQKDADGDFFYQMQILMASMTWSQLARLIGCGTNYPIPTKEWADAFHYVMHMLALAFNVKDYQNMKKDSGHLVIQDRDALDEWPVAARKRRSKEEKEDKMSKSEAARVMSGKSKLKAAADDEDEEDDIEEVEEEVEEEEEDEAEEADEVEEDDEDEEESDESDEEDEDEDEDDSEDEEPVKPAKSAKGTKNMKTKNEVAVKGKKSKFAVKAEDAPVKTGKKSKVVEADATPAKKAKRVKVEAVVLKDTSIIKPGKPRSGGGPKGKFHALVTKKGIALKALLALAKEELDVKPEAAKKWVGMMHKNGFLTIG